MTTTPSVLKSQRQANRRRLRNRAVISTLKTLTKHLASLVEAKQSDEARKALAHVTRALDKAATKGVLHRNNASRRISRLTRKVQQLHPPAGRS